MRTHYDNLQIRAALPALLVFMAALAVSIDGLAAGIGPDCTPKGVSAIAREAWNPREFWAKQLKEINDYVVGAKQTYQLTIIDRRREAIEASLDDQEMRAIGITPEHDPAFDREMAEVDREGARFDLEMLQHSIAWGDRCTRYATRMLSESK